MIETTEARISSKIWEFYEEDMRRAILSLQIPTRGFLDLYKYVRPTCLTDEN